MRLDEEISLKDHYYSQCRLKNSSWQVFWQDSASETGCRAVCLHTVHVLRRVSNVCSVKLVTCGPIRY